MTELEKHYNKNAIVKEAVDTAFIMVIQNTWLYKLLKFIKRKQTTMQTQKDLINFVVLVKDMRQKQIKAKTLSLMQHQANEAAKAVDIWLAGHQDINVKIAELTLNAKQKKTVKRTHNLSSYLYR